MYTVLSLKTGKNFLDEKIIIKKSYNQVNKV